MLFALLLLAGCSQQVPSTPRKLLAIPSALQEIHALNDRAALLNKLRMTGNVNLTLTNH